MVVFHKKSLNWSFFGLWDSIFESNLVPWVSVDQYIVVCRWFYERFSFHLLGGDFQLNNMEHDSWLSGTHFLRICYPIFICIYLGPMISYTHFLYSWQSYEIYTLQICVWFDGDTDHKTNPTFFEAPCTNLLVTNLLCIIVR